MDEIDKTDMSEQTKFRVNEISKIQDYFNSEMNQRKSCCKKLSKYTGAFDDVDKVLVLLSATSGGVSICWFTRLLELL